MHRTLARWVRHPELLGCREGEAQAAGVIEAIRGYDFDEAEEQLAALAEVIKA